MSKIYIYLLVILISSLVLQTSMDVGGTRGTRDKSSGRVGTIGNDDDIHMNEQKNESSQFEFNAATFQANLENNQQNMAFTPIPHQSRSNQRQSRSNQPQSQTSFGSNYGHNPHQSRSNQYQSRPNQPQHQQSRQNQTTFGSNYSNPPQSRSNQPHHKQSRQNQTSFGSNYSNPPQSRSNQPQHQQSRQNQTSFGGNYANRTRSDSPPRSFIQQTNAAQQQQQISVFTPNNPQSAARHLASLPNITSNRKPSSATSNISTANGMINNDAKTQYNDKNNAY